MEIHLPYLTRSAAPMRRNAIIPALCVGLGLFEPTTTLPDEQVTFTIHKGRNMIGTIVAVRRHIGERTHYSVRSFAQVDVVLKQVVRTAMDVTYTQGIVSDCHATLRINDNMRDSSRMVSRSDEEQCYVHPGPAVVAKHKARWTTARMYFEEPFDQQSIFVESVLAHCPLRPSGLGQYTLTFPNGNVNRYVYQHGKLAEIQVDRALVDLVFRRKS